MTAHVRVVFVTGFSSPSVCACQRLLLRLASAGAIARITFFPNRSSTPEVSPLSEGAWASFRPSSRHGHSRVLTITTGCLPDGKHFEKSMINAACAVGPNILQSQRIIRCGVGRRRLSIDPGHRPRYTPSDARLQHSWMACKTSNWPARADHRRQSSPARSQIVGALASQSWVRHAATRDQKPIHIPLQTMEESVSRCQKLQRSLPSAAKIRP